MYNSEKWEDTTELKNKSYTCGHCGAFVSPSYGYVRNQDYNHEEYAAEYIAICTNCNKPTYIDVFEQYPGMKGGFEVDGITDENLNSIYDEARNCIEIGAYSACLLCCRKALMHIGVDCGEKEDLQFVKYVEYLNNNGYIPPKGKSWVKKIKDLGNEATHEIKIATKEDAELAINFLGMLLKFIYEMPMLLSNSKNK